MANRIFETWLYNLYLSTADMQKKDIYAASLLDKNQFIVDGHLNMRLVLEKFVMHFNQRIQRKYFAIIKKMVDYRMQEIMV